MSSLRRLPWPVHAPLLAAWAVLFLYGQNLDELTILDILPALAWAVAGALLVVIAFGIVARDVRRGGIVAFAVLLTWFGWGHATEVVPPDPLARTLLGAGFIAFIAMSMLAAHRLGERRIAGLTRGLDLLAALLVAIAALGAAPATWADLTDAPPALADRPAPTPGDRDIWYLLLDRFGSARSIEAYAGVEPTLPGRLEAHGFEVAHDARASFVKTALSLASTLGMTQLEDLVARMGPESADEAPLTVAIRDHAVGRFLRDRGYRIIQLGSWFMPSAQSAIADTVLVPSTGNDFDRLFRETTLLALWEELTVPPIGHNDAQHRDFARYQLHELEHLRTAPHREPRFIFAHILLPHPPYVFDEQGGYPTAEERAAPEPERYARQLAWTEAQIGAFVERLVDVPEAERPIVIVAADEGPYPPRYQATMKTFDWRTATDEELVIKFGTLLAIELPMAGEPRVTERMTTANIFRLVLARAFGADLPLLPDRSWASLDATHPYRLIDITGDLDRIDAGG